MWWFYVLQVILVLSAHSADMNVINLDICTPLHYAAASGNANCCKFLVQRGTKRKSLDSSQLLPLITGTQTINTCKLLYTYIVNRYSIVCLTLLLSDVTVSWDCQIYHNCHLLLFVSHSFVCQELSVCLDGSWASSSHWQDLLMSATSSLCHRRLPWRGFVLL